MWKEWFYYTRGERRVIIILLFVLFMIISLVIIESSSEKSFIPDNNTLSLTDSIMKKIKESSGGFVRDSFLYVKKSSEKQYKKYIHQTNSREEVNESNKDTGKINFKPKYKKQEKFPEGTLVDINTADTTILKKVPGIGRVISRNIVDYRERLGGFYDINQLLEVRYVDSSLLKWFKLESGIYRKLKVNTDNIDVLKSHPYMNYYKAKAIVNYRNRRGKISNYLQISILKEFSAEDEDKLKRYLDFQ